MSLSAHINELRKKHQSLSDQVEREQRSPGCDPLRLTQMKKEKLQLKQEIARLTNA